MRRKIIRIFSVFLFFCGLILFLYPSFTNWYAGYESNKVMQTFKKDLVELQKLADKNASNDDSSKTNSLEKLYQDMVLYNEKIYAEGQKDLKDPFSYEMPSFELKDYGFKNNVIGIITIPKMEVELPLYLGANESNMAKGAVVLGQTSMPIGGISTNSVIAAHRGYKGIKMFRDIEKLEVGDEIYIETPWNTLYYRVTEIKIVLPDETDEIFIQSGKDMITLVTCHPYTKNSHRYLVYAIRCYDSSTSVDENISKENSSKSDISSEENSTMNNIEFNSEKNIGYETEPTEGIENNSSQTIWLETYLPYIGGVIVILVAIICMLLSRNKENKIKND